MKKIGGLGSIPKGLEWIGSTIQESAQSNQLTGQSTGKPAEHQIVTHLNASHEEVDNISAVPLVEEKKESIQPMLSVSSASSSTQESASVITNEKAKKRTHKPVVTSATAGLPEGFTRATFIVRQEHVERLKALSYVRQLPIKDLVDTAMTKFLKDKDVHTILSEALNHMNDQ